MLLDLISRIFDPLVVLGYIMVAAAWRSGMNLPAFELFILVMILGMVCLPISVLAWAIYTKRIGNWDVSDRRERVLVLTAFFPFMIVDFLIIKYFGNISLLRIYLGFVIWYAGFYLITLFWKVSGHAAAAALSSAFIIRWWGWAWAPVLLIVPIISWIRVKQKNHTPAQTIVGAGYSWAMFLVCIVLGLV